MMAAMNLALLANNVGLMWVGVEVATLSTVMMVGLYRTPEAIEAAWKYFILGSVGIGLAFLALSSSISLGRRCWVKGCPRWHGICW
jgi:hydrogenase-4 component F